MPHLAKEVVELGTQCVFGIPGEGLSLDLLAELESRGCPLYLTAHEAAAALMAGGLGRVTGRPGMSVSIKGPGFANMLSGIVCNWFDRNPAISLSESYGAGSSPYRMHKRLPHSCLARRVVKANVNSPSPDSLKSIWQICIDEEPGPVHIDISSEMHQSMGSVHEETKRGGALSDAARQLIRKAQKPIVIAGALASRRPWREKLRSLGIPIFTTVAGKGAVDENVGVSAGIFTNSGGPSTPERQLIPQADLVVGLGLRTTELLDVSDFSVPLIVLDELANRATGLAAAVEDVLCQESFGEVLELLQVKEWGIDEVQRAKSHLERKLCLDEWLVAGALRAVEGMLPPETLFFLDTGNFSVMGEHVLSACRPCHINGSSIGRAMGIGIPTSIGAAVGVRGTPIVTVVGDGGIRMYYQELTLAVREKLPMLILLCADGFLSSVRCASVKRHLSQIPVRLEAIPWPKVVGALGCQTERIKSFAGLEAALHTWDKDTGPLFLELAFDPDRYMAMTEDIR